ncbi:hypothetical protein BP6252_06587 [Coleophoma cylindrospora]|uniref:Heterokaryon incompatibility domain-containing protein n=1 Tax=Coleophoma cylindrospora TaxID=1849047 RepID=A0A3D8RN14_9HELO|nr:hypothetical protein BP6252_06587 [Coleophoma cylindrospora]
MDDTHKTFGEIFGPDTVAYGDGMKMQMLDIQRLICDRSDSQKWARSLRFLVYDGDDLVYDRHPHSNVIFTEDEVPLCSYCRNVPCFPRDVLNGDNANKIRRFKLLQRGKIHGMSQCNHYLAVSYCWTPAASSSGTTSYTVSRNPQAEPEKGRARDDVVDRAVQVAADYGIRYIWIDQECIDQRDPDDQEASIQSMDLVYENAWVVLGLLNTTISERRQWEVFHCLEEALSQQGHKVPAFGDPESYAREIALPLFEVFERADAMVALLETIVHNDLWFTRRWILQEMICSGDRLMLLIDSDYMFSPHRQFGFHVRRLTADFELVLDVLVWWVFNRPPRALRLKDLRDNVSCCLKSIHNESSSKCAAKSVTSNAPDTFLGMSRAVASGKSISESHYD